MFSANKYKDLLEQVVPLSDNEWKSILPLFKNKFIKKGDYFSKKGVISTQLGIVNSGIMRSFFFVNDKEISTFFHFGGSVAVAMYSFLKQMPAKESIQALTDTNLMVIQKDDLYNLYDKNNKWQKIGRILIEQYYVKMEERMIILQSVSAKERYKLLIEHQPDIIKNIPLCYIASYLGISPETLSRIRRSL